MIVVDFSKFSQNLNVIIIFLKSRHDFFFLEQSLAMLCLIGTLHRVDQSKFLKMLLGLFQVHFKTTKLRI